MMFGEIRRAVDRVHSDRLSQLAVLGRGEQVRRKVAYSLRVIERWLSSCERPAISVSGGKDSTLLLMLVRDIDPSVPAYRADGPPRIEYSDRAEHVRQLELVSGGVWHVVSYAWDVDAYLRGDIPYRSGHQRRALLVGMTSRGVDGVGLGLRRGESKGRKANADYNGLIYRARGWRLTCTPLAYWSAAEVVGYILARDQLPLNPVYRRTHLQPDLEHLRDGTWLPWATADAHGQRQWLAYHYPEHLSDYDRVLYLTGGGLVHGRQPIREFRQDLKR